MARETKPIPEYAKKCVFLDEGKKKCNALTEFLCKRDKKCPFFKTKM